MKHRLLEIDAERMVRWADGFAERHGRVEVSVDSHEVRLTAADGAVAQLEVPVIDAAGADLAPADLDPDPVAAVAAIAARDRDLAILLVRRGGFAVGLATGQKLTAHKVGRRYVQGRTAAGGWSQHRFARRRDDQAAKLVGAARDAAHHLWSGRRFDVLVPGGDRSLVAEVLDDPRLATAAALPRTPLLDVADPRLDVLTQAVRRSRAIRVRLSEPQ